MKNSYLPSQVEKDRYDWWKTKGYFQPSNKSNKRSSPLGKKFIIPLPPPNVTGNLHIGHALTVAIEDTLVRWHRMKGDDTLYIPGTDHAGIATQVVVESKLKKETGKSRHDIGRDEFVKKIWEYKEEKQHNIKNQLTKLGTSVDWSRERFTLDDGCCEAVKEAFVTLYEQGLIYRDYRFVNWCCELQSAISDEEVDKEEVGPEEKWTIPGYYKKVQMGMMYHFAYKIKEFPDEEIIVATTRPETIIGDVAVCVHSSDERYKKYHGCNLICPFGDCIGAISETIPLLLDDILVDMNFGTGAVKVTPAHDQDDYEAGKRHNLPCVNVIDTKGYISVEGEFKNMHRFECRDKLVASLEQKGLLRKKEPYANRVGRCSRTKDIIEPMLMKQWFCNCQTMAKRADDILSSGELKLIPESYNNVWHHWLQNNRPWCISRQLWWGHRIPAYICKLDGNLINDDSWVAGRSEEEAKQKAIVKFNISPEQVSLLTLEQDPDVLDTWFSSALWPMSILGWPQLTPDFENYFPNSLLETGHDILFFWVARMVMMSLHFTNQLPFKHVYLHGLIRDKNGDKMSKQRGNVIDPLDIINGCTLEHLKQQTINGNLNPKEVDKALKTQKKYFPNGIQECGSDALRYGLLAYTNGNKDINFDVEHIVGCRKFGNKIWNAVKYVLFCLGDNFDRQIEINTLNKNQMPLECGWILSKLDQVIQDCNTHFEKYDLASITVTLRQFLWHDFCDTFLEVIKPTMQKENDDLAKQMTQDVLLYTIEIYLRLLHPLMPYLTEELWQYLPNVGLKTEESIMISQYPEYRSIEDKMRILTDLAHQIRSKKTELQMKRNDKPDCWIICSSRITFEIIKIYQEQISTLGLCGHINIIEQENKEFVPLDTKFVFHI